MVAEHLLGDAITILWAMVGSAWFGAYANDIRSGIGLLLNSLYPAAQSIVKGTFASPSG